jgi:peptide/nickel transport system permease protein
MPSGVLAGLMLIVLFSVKLGWFPTSGMEEVAAFKEDGRA